MLLRVQYEIQQLTDLQAAQLWRILMLQRFSRNGPQGQGQAQGQGGACGTGREFQMAGQHSARVVSQICLCLAILVSLSSPMS